MSEIATEASEKRYAQLRYGSHIAIMTGKEGEPVSLDGVGTISDLLSTLDVKYPGIKELFMPPNDIFNIRTAITLRRAGQPTRGIIDPMEKIEDSDILLLW
ncbi:MAG: MoaD/ThiS family protein [Deltaproteobacteria bacterium]|nr:MoaD/ThiS family protein [Deltaproteobacteria bacterium]MBW2209103.1 MoaD/ThiS family protein [Deltaproteobacteria bacterium]